MATEMSPASPSLRRHRVATGEVELFAVSAGEGPLVVLLHGFPENWRSWERQIGPLSERFFVVAPDLRGYGESDRPRGGYDLGQLAADIRGLIDELGGGRPARVVGHDWGGAIAWALAYEHPEVVERLSILNSPHPHLFARRLLGSGQLLRSWYMFAFQIPVLPEWLLAAGNGAVLRWMARSGAARKDALTDAEIDEMVGPLLGKGALRAPLQYYRTAFWAGPGAARRYRGTLQMPVQVLWGTADKALGVDLLRGLDRYVDDLHVQRIEGVGHWVQREAPREVNEALLAWLGSEPGGD